MKTKLVVFLVFFVMLFSSKTAFAVETIVDFDFSVPILFEWTKTANSRMTSIGLGINPRVMFTNIIGIGAVFDLVIPVKQTTSSGGVQKIIRNSDLDSWVGFQMALGPAIVPVNKEKFRLYLLPGFHLNTVSYRIYPLRSSIVLIGVGTSVMSEFQLTKMLYVNVGFGLYYDFYGSIKVEDRSTLTVTASNSQFTHDLTFQPKLGVGIRF